MKRLALAAILAFLATAAQAEPTHVMVRAKALDAKFIGTHMGGVRITLRDARTGAVLAKGVTSGGTGDTATIMKQPRLRGAAITNTDTAGFDAVLDISSPTLVRAEAEGPVGKPASAIKIASSLLVVPGRNVSGDGWVLTFPGLVIEPAAQPAADGSLQVSAKVTLMCGCPIEPGGVWNAANYTVEATLMQGQRTVAHIPLAYAGQASQFAGVFTPPAAGRYVLRVLATDATSPNAGMTDQKITIRGTR
jgi:hypothetical protein